MLIEDKDKLQGLGTYIDGKMKRYNLLFAVNGGAFALAKLLFDPKTENILGKLTLKHLAIGAVAFTFLMWFDIWLWGENMRTGYFNDKEVFQWRGKAILSLLASLLIIGWLLVALKTMWAIILFTVLLIAGWLLLYVPYKKHQALRRVS
ncbi:MAG: hypothetical protein DMF64_12050 [Acidobacteria bacterium]|nr:MAG: hypothetical protein DMF64_12050 [Acidobacteriota bacterium]